MFRLVFVLVFWMSVLPLNATDGGVREGLRVRCSWFPPESGSLPVRYHLQIQDVETGSPFDTTYVVDHVGGSDRIEQEFVFLDGEFWKRYRARVRAEDAMDRVGPWSDWSEPKAFEEPEPEF